MPNPLPSMFTSLASVLPLVASGTGSPPLTSPNAPSFSAAQSTSHAFQLGRSGSSAGGGGGKGAKDRDPSRPPRPMNAWLLFRTAQLRQIQEDNPGMRKSQGELSKIISEMWKNCDPEVRAGYEALAKQRKVEHQRIYPDYRYAPNSRPASSSSAPASGKAAKPRLSSSSTRKPSLRLSPSSAHTAGYPSLSAPPSAEGRYSTSSSSSSTTHSQSHSPSHSPAYSALPTPPQPLSYIPYDGSQWISPPPQYLIRPAATPILIPPLTAAAAEFAARNGGSGYGAFPEVEKTGWGRAPQSAPATVTRFATGRSLGLTFAPESPAQVEFSATMAPSQLHHAAPPLSASAARFSHLVQPSQPLSHHHPQQPQEYLPPLASRASLSHASQYSQSAHASSSHSSHYAHQQLDQQQHQQYISPSYISPPPSATLPHSTGERRAQPQRTVYGSASSADWGNHRDSVSFPESGEVAAPCRSSSSYEARNERDYTHPYLPYAESSSYPYPHQQLQPAPSSLPPSSFTSTSSSSIATGARSASYSRPTSSSAASIPGGRPHLHPRTASYTFSTAQSQSHAYSLDSEGEEGYHVTGPGGTGGGEECYHEQ
ncbi:hypothetical protein JCM11641_006944 [Rhodosporidiobolus odoratus]